jgi:ABC-type nitrate/sulfonate/bicarbonate transport system substrate-binding protein
MFTSSFARAVLGRPIKADENREADLLTRRQAIATGASAGALLAAPAIGQGLAKVWLGVPNAATDVGYFVAHARGYFRDEGLDVEIIPFDSAARMIAPMASGDLQVAAGGPSAGLYNGVARGMDIRMVSDKSKNVVHRSSVHILVRKELMESGRVKTIADLKGLKYANGVFPGIGYSAFAIDPDGHAIQLYHSMEQIGWDGRPKPADQRPLIDHDAWPETVAGDPAVFDGEVYLGPFN